MENMAVVSHSPMTGLVWEGLVYSLCALQNCVSRPAYTISMALWKFYNLSLLTLTNWGH